MTNKERERFTTLTALHPLKSKRIKGIRIFVLTNGLLAGKGKVLLQITDSSKHLKKTLPDLTVQVHHNQDLPDLTSRRIRWTTILVSQE